MKINLSELVNTLEDVPELFICSASFEDRCLSIANQLDPDRVRYVVILENADFGAHVRQNVVKLKQRFKEKARTVQLRTNDPFFVADNLKKCVMPVLAECAGPCLVDVTTFTHEQVLIFIKMLFALELVEKTVLAYAGASEYSVGSDEAERWLSKGLTTVRAVLGYPGLMLPSRKLHLIILTGFEYERAEKLIEWYEPALLSLGLGRREPNMNVNHQRANAEFHARVRDFAENFFNLNTFVRKFEFSCSDPCQTMKDILMQADEHPSFNTAVCPMNTKPSTIGAALAAITREDIQLIYTQPVEYNTKGYSSPSDQCTLFNLSECFAETSMLAPV
jgi:hypothetical protein